MRMCGNAAVPTIKQKIKAKKLRREVSKAVRAFSSPAGSPANCCAWRGIPASGADRAFAPFLPAVQAFFAASASLGTAAKAFSAAAISGAGAFAAFNSATFCSAAALSAANAAGTSFNFSANASARALKIARTSSSFGSLISSASLAVTFSSC